MTNTATGPQQPAGPQFGGSVRAIWIALIMIIAVMVGVAAGLLASASGASVATAVLTSGGTFAGTVMLLMALLNFALGKST
jgi:predicted branched-subunit amino acid permease